MNSGRANGWGLYNYVGNVQEWVDTGNGIAARGGAYTDELSNCGITLERNHDGSGDALTGFRLLRELR